MLTKQIVVAAVLAAVQGVAAQNTFSTDKFAPRVGTELMGDSCHPLETWTIPSSNTIPPCISEQFISSSCENMTGALGNTDNKTKTDAYRQCLFGNGSSYERDIFACLDCKRMHNVHFEEEDAWWKGRWTKAISKFKKAEHVNKGLWNYVSEDINWPSYPKKPAGFTGETDKRYTVNDYYPNAPKQNIGTFTLNDITYPNYNSRALRARAESAAHDGSRDIKVTFHSENGHIVHASVE